MRRLRRIVLSAVMAGTAAGVAAPAAAAVSAVGVMAQESEYQVSITASEGGRVESNAAVTAVYEDGREIFGKVPAGQQLKLSAVPEEGYEFASWDFQGSVQGYAVEKYQSVQNAVIDTADAKGAVIKAKAVFVKKQDGTHIIQNGTEYGSMPESAKTGEKVHIETGEPDWAKDYRDNPREGEIYLGYGEDYEIRRISDGKDVTDEVMVNSKDFIMPDYDIKVITAGKRSGIVYTDKTGDKVADEIEWETEVFKITGYDNTVEERAEVHEGETVTLKPLESGENISGSYTIYREEDDENVTGELEWIDDRSFYMPGYNIVVAKSSSVFKNAETGDEVYNIVNESGADVQEKASPGEEVFLKTPLPQRHQEYIEKGYQNVSYNEHYSIIRISDGADVTEELLDEATDSFIMPEYDVKVITRYVNSSIGLKEEGDNVLSQLTDDEGNIIEDAGGLEEESRAGIGDAGDTQEKVLSLITEPDGTVVDEENTTAGSAAGQVWQKPVSGDKNTEVKSFVKTQGSDTVASASSSGITTPVRVVRAASPAATGTVTASPVATRRSGTNNPTVVNTAPATGDSSSTVAWIIAAGAASAAAAAAVIITMKSRREEQK